MAIKTLVLVGDSLTQGTYLDFAYSRGGQGSWFELVRDRLANIEGVGPLVSSGIRCIELGVIGSVEWSFTSGADAWPSTVSSLSWDKHPYGFGKYAFGASKIATYTLPSNQPPNVGFALYWIDIAVGGNWQYRVDGGAWTNMNQTRVGDDKICKFYVSTPVTSTVQIRAASNDTTGANCVPYGIELFYVDPNNVTNGLIIHNLGLNGRELHEHTLVTSGDRLAFHDSVKLGTGNPPSSTANAGTIMMHINDATLINDTTIWANDLTTFYNRVSPLGPVGIMSPWEYYTNFTQQANYRAQTKTSIAGFATPPYLLDFYDEWSTNGWTGYAATNAAGLIADGVHESQLGHMDIANRVYWWIRTKFLNIQSNTSAYPVHAAVSTSAVNASNPSVIYTATAPIILK